jgi:predicted TIM-barrel fold metal-dependent hydrolase
LAEALIVRTASWNEFRDAFPAQLTTISPHVVALKSIVAYRTGLSVHQPDEHAAAACFRQLRAGVGETASPRLACKPLNDWVVWTTLRVAADVGTPVQFHTGFGDPDLDLREASPLNLRPLLENAGFAGVPIVLLHASYPFMREAGYLASVYPNVFVDMGLAVPMLSVRGMVATVGALLELAPVSKVMFSSDAHLIPELFYLGAKWGRQVLAQVLEQTIRDGDLTVEEANATAERILRQNAIDLYDLAQTPSSL